MGPLWPLLLSLVEIMRLSKKNLTIFLSLMGILSLCAGFIILYLSPLKEWSFSDLLDGHSVSSTNQEKLEREVMAHVLEEVSYLWRYGDTRNWLESVTSCEEFTKAADVYGQRVLQCNPDFVNCFGQSRSFRKHFQKSGVEVDLIGEIVPVHFLDYPEVQTFGYKARVLVGSTQGHIILPSLCHEVALPRRMYPLNAAEENERLAWDSMNQYLFVDKFQVTNRDLKVWAKLSGASEVKELVAPLVEGKSPYSQATGLNSSQMRNYCSFFGKQVLSSQVLDAMSFHPGNLDRVRAERFSLAPYPWSIRERDGFLYEIREGEKERPTQEDCHLVTTAECFEDWPELVSSPQSPTWSGIFQVLGGLPEYVRNPYRPRDNLRASSIYFPATSSWHRLGARAYWDGEGDQQRNFNWRFESPPEVFDRFEVAFRCMRWEYRQ